MEKHLWEINHPYYSNNSNYYAPGNNQPVALYDSWADFFKAEGNSDYDMNLLFRFDWRAADPDGKAWGNEKETLFLYWIGQRKGLYRWSEIVVSKDDEPSVREWLSVRFDYLKSIWEPFT